ncbi:molybdopterin-guanine dinucleotide biosynthesis protein B [Alkalilimnicola ehrlichii MLHE-1]|uniref:Molybdopterin guanine dinucleotide biosynthesis accessory protein MobB n=1 Tax=Alkalilimnicola ehrlichii (strain ATCC BAA-1101 / DSM 17681 / MLHE-1) TaxID=187272 RepID=Q0A886_ALKEH|nr:molybdopterin-guanine dinucleotide biosynthesis protein B [Alkalilimnicola ehrlichii]ABI56951.1 molybdopterin guanine dinucleotide biosynthesis accessory protein MobB [Alkalilimnicola ehrlichii MLHE-1]
MRLSPDHPWGPLWPDGARIPVVGVAGWSGAGKTTLLEGVIRSLSATGLRVGLVKHAHHRFDVDKPGKDSYRLREAGAGQVLLTSGRRFALMVERPATQSDPLLSEELARLDQSRLDLIVVEGFRHERFPKIEVYRPRFSERPLHPDDPAIIAVATDEPAAVAPGHITLPLNDPEAVADFLRRHL